MKYAKQSLAPEFFDNSNPLHVNAIAGTSPYNEWYAFESHEDAIETIANFNSLSFFNEMTIFQGDLHFIEDLELDENYNPTGVKNPQFKNDFKAAVVMESRF